MLQTPPNDGASPSSSTQVSVPEIVLKQTLRVGALGATVAAAFYPLDLIMQRLHVKPKMPKMIGLGGPATGRIPFMAILSKLVRGYLTAAQAATLKNGVLSHREQIHSTLHDKGDSTTLQLLEEDASNAASSSAKSPSTFATAQYREIAATSLVVGALDTTFTHYHRGIRVLQQQMVLNPSYAFTRPQTIGQKLTFARNGYLQLGGKNVATVLGMLVTQQLQAQAAASPQGRFSEENLGLHGLTLGVVGVVAAGANATDLLYKNALTQISPTYVAPTFRAVARKLIAEEGRKVMRRGLLGSFVYTGAAYGIVNQSERFVESVVMPKGRKKRLPR